MNANVERGETPGTFHNQNLFARVDLTGRAWLNPAKNVGSHNLGACGQAGTQAGGVGGQNLDDVSLTIMFGVKGIN